MRSALEQERDLILEQIQASREIYRQILATPTSVSATSKRKIMPSDFPRSRTFRWIIDHPYVTTSAFAALIWLGVNRLLKNHSTKYQSKKVARASSPIKALIAVGAILLQNPSRLKIIRRVVGTVLAWIKN
jgi:hypothetical protein